MQFGFSILLHSSSSCVNFHCWWFDTIWFHHTLKSWLESRGKSNQDGSFSWVNGWMGENSRVWKGCVTAGAPRSCWSLFVRGNLSKEEILRRVWSNSNLVDIPTQPHPSYQGRGAIPIPTNPLRLTCWLTTASPPTSSKQTESSQPRTFKSIFGSRQEGTSLDFCSLIHGFFKFL